MFMLQIEFRTPINFVCKKFGGASNIPPKLFIRKSSSGTILNDLAVIDVIVCEKSLRKKALRVLKGAGRQVQVYN